MDGLVARLVEQGIDPATFEWYGVTEDQKPTVRPGTHYAGTLTLPRLGSLRESIRGLAIRPLVVRGPVGI